MCWKGWHSCHATTNGHCSPSCSKVRCVDCRPNRPIIGTIHRPIPMDSVCMDSVCNVQACVVWMYASKTHRPHRGGVDMNTPVHRRQTSEQ